MIKIPKYHSGLSKKLALKYHGPYKIIAQTSPLVYKVTPAFPSSKMEKQVRTVNVRLLRPYLTRSNSVNNMDNTTFDLERNIEDEIITSDVEEVDYDLPENETENTRQTEYVTRYGRVSKKPVSYAE